MKPFSVFIPVYNEEEILERNLEKLTGFLQGFSVPFEIILVSNGSCDRTVEIGTALGARNGLVKFFHIPFRGAVGEAFKKATEVSRYPHLICIDMDLSVDLNFVARAASLLDEYEMVVGAKKAGAQNRPLLRKLGSLAYVSCAKLLLHLPFDDYSPAAKAYRKEAISRYLPLLARETSFATNLLYYGNRDSVRCIQFPVACNDNRKSKFGLLHLGFHMFLNLFRLWIMKR